MNTHNDDEPCDCTPEEITEAKRIEALRWERPSGHPGSKSPMRPAAIKVRRKRERQNRVAGRRRNGGD